MDFINDFDLTGDHWALLAALLKAQPNDRLDFISNGLPPSKHVLDLTCQVGYSPVDSAQLETVRFSITQR